MSAMPEMVPPPAEREALESFELSRFIPSAEVYGGHIVLSATNGRVVKLVLSAGSNRYSLEPMKRLPDEILAFHDLAALEISGCARLYEFPQSIGDLKNLVGLSLGNVEVMPKNIGTLSNLTHLTIRGSPNLRTLPLEMRSFHNLKHFLMESCDKLLELPSEVILQWDSLESLSVAKMLPPKNIGLFRNLQHLKFIDCNSRVLPAEVGNLTKLTDLCLSSCPWCEAFPKEIEKLLHLNVVIILRSRVPKEIGLIKNLQFLKYEPSGFNSPLPAEIGDASNLTKLSLVGRFNTKFPPQVSQLEGLLKIDFRGILRIPGNIGLFSNLECLDLSKNHELTEVPADIGQLQNLKYLNLSGCCDLTEIPTEIGLLRNLKCLNLSGCNNLLRYPDVVSLLPSLEELNLASCQEITHLPVNIGDLQHKKLHVNISGCQQLQELHGKAIGLLLSKTYCINLVDCSCLRSLPKQIGQVKNLQELDLSHCKRLSCLPPEIGQLSNMTRLTLHYCMRLKELPKEIGQLHSLRHLDVSCTSRLTKLPPELGQAISLTTLNLSYCTQLKALPKELYQLPNLKGINVEGCIRLTSEALLEIANSCYSLHTLKWGSGSGRPANENDVVIPEYFFDFYRNLTQAGRYLLQCEGVPLSLWSVVLGKIKDPAIMFWFLTANPELFMQTTIYERAETSRLVGKGTSS